MSLLRAENKKLQSKLADAQKAEEKQRDEKREKREALERAKKRLREEEERHEGTKNCLKRRIDEYAARKIDVLLGDLGSLTLKQSSKRPKSLSAVPSDSSTRSHSEFIYSRSGFRRLGAVS